MPKETHYENIYTITIWLLSTCLDVSQSGTYTRMVYDDYESSFSALLNKDKSFTIHERDIQTMAIEMYKVYKGLAPDIMKYMFPMNILYCSKQVFQTRNVHTVHNGTETLSFLGPKMLSIIPNDFKLSKNLLEFKTKIKK